MKKDFQGTFCFTSIKRCGMTLLEVLIAAGLLSMLILGVLSIYSSGSRSFTLGEWRISTQKSAQILLNSLREDLEKANSPATIQTNGQMVLDSSIPVQISDPAYNAPSGTKKILVASNTPLSTRVPVAFFSITTPRVDASPFVPVASPGLWLGCALGFQGNTLIYRRTGSVALHNSDPVALPGPVITQPGTPVAVGNAFEPNLQRNTVYSLKDVESISFNHITTGNQSLEIKIICRHQKPSLSSASLEESVVCKLLPNTSVQSF